MPSALETLVKILKLEREQGCKNSAVIGGLSAFSEKWTVDAHTQARKPEHHLLVDEISSLLKGYEQIANKTERSNTIGYMLDRIMGRVPPPPEYQAQLQTPPPQSQPQPPPPQAPPAEAKEQTAPPQQQPRQKKERPAKEQDRQRGSDAKPPRPPAKGAPTKKKRAQNEDEDDEGGGVEEVAFQSYDAFDTPSYRGRDRGRGAQSGGMDIPTPPRLARVQRKPRKAISPDEASDILKGLYAPVTTIKGVGPTMEKSLGRLGIRNINDLLYFFPRRYDDYTRLSTIARLPIGEVATVIGSVRHAEVRAGRTGRKDFFMVLDDGSARMGVTFFGQHYLIRSIRVGQQVVLSGQTSIYGNQIQMANPEWEHLDVSNLHTIGIVPVYPLTEGLSGRALRKLMKSAITYWTERIPDFVPEGTLERADLADLGWAIKNRHFPEGWDHLEHARNRIVFDELLLLQLAVMGNRREWQAVPGVPLNISDEFLDSFVQTVFPYPLTGAQQRAIADIRGDVSQAVPMNRLLQGDVGSGKTAVATVALAFALENGKQGAIMVPTSILAEQHYRSISATLEKMPFHQKPVIALLTSALSGSERASIYRGLADGSIDIAVGTHALIQEGVEFNDLAVAIIDEQHRFGVEQRKALRGKGTNPHLLVMTATPIPRTLALTMFADLDLSIIDEMPPGRIPIQTRVVSPVERERVYSFVESQLNQGRQAFVVHPLVEASEKIEAPSAMEAYERLQNVFFHHRVGLLHGRMKPGEKDEVMAAFSEARYDVLVTTSVAEVGVNVPNATVMVIEGANRFGLAQLHQFRGRVGRGDHASYCLLLSDSNSEEAQARLGAMEETTDGFKLAEMDWKLRGAGDLVGTEQSGGTLLQAAQDMTPQLVELAQREARTIYAEDPALTLEQHRLLAERVNQLHNERSDVS